MKVWILLLWTSLAFAENVAPVKNVKLSKLQALQMRLQTAEIQFLDERLLRMQAEFRVVQITREQKEQELFLLQQKAIKSAGLDPSTSRVNTETQAIEQAPNAAAHSSSPFNVK